MRSHEQGLRLVSPARVSFLAIYNPTLVNGGPAGVDSDAGARAHGEATLDNQIVFYYAYEDHDEQAGGLAGTRREQDAANERLRRVGLAQGMVAFARNFSESSDIDHVETATGRLVLRELEPNWWALASIDFTRFTHATSSDTANADSDRVEYSSREVAPAHLLLQQLTTAHTLFLLHNGSSLADLHARAPMPRLRTLLSRFWTSFISNWDVMLHGSPVTELYAGVKVCGAGELGFGVGEEAWGSSERDVLEGIVEQTEGLIDVVASRFGDAPGALAPMRMPYSSHSADPCESWCGRYRQLAASDGVFFAGSGALATASVAQISRWMEWIFRFGPNAYGMRRAEARKRPNRRHPRSRHEGQSQPRQDVSHATPDAHNSDKEGTRILAPGIPPPLVSAADVNAARAQASSAQGQSLAKRQPSLPDVLQTSTDALVKVLTLGYGSWGGVASRAKEDQSQPATDEAPGPPAGAALASGQFLLGWKGPFTHDDTGRSADDPRHRVTLRRLHVEAQHRLFTVSTDSLSGSKEVIALVYGHQPFMYTLLFEPDCEALTSEKLHFELHQQLSSFWKPLMHATSVDRWAEKQQAQGLVPHAAQEGDKALLIHSYDSATQLIHSTIPSIPEIGAAAPRARLSRADALHIHIQMMHTLIEARATRQQREVTIKTARGWWIKWTAHQGEERHEDLAGLVSLTTPRRGRRETLLVRKAVEKPSGTGRSTWTLGSLSGARLGPLWQSSV